MIGTGIKGLDRVITGLRSGDNVVWQIDAIKDYSELVKPFAQEALKEKKKLIYMRFASHGELIKPSKSVKRYELNPYAGFESFTTKVNNIIEEEGEGAYYIFDSLSELLSAWASDLMIGNFFMVTCPHLYELKTVTYFAIMRNNHSFKSIAQIRETTQLLMDVYHFGGNFYVHPLKVWNRYTPTMFLPHRKKGSAFLPISDSVNTGKLLSYISAKGAETAKRNLDYWDLLFMEAEELLRDKAPKAKIREMAGNLCKLMMTKNKKMLPFVTRRFTLDELVQIKSRLIGTGFIGGKSVGMLLARKILSENKSLNTEDLFEPHDSFYVGSDIFYSYIVQNKLWKLRMQQKTKDGYFPIAKILGEKILYGTFSEEIKENFQRIIEYFGSSPIIIRSSSLLEDSFGNAFAGKYESIFLANQGTPEERYIKFAEAVRKIYASTMSEDALVYRKQRGLDKMDEQMALLVQRVSGSYHKNYFFPDLAGVGVSYNTYVWREEMDPKAGILRVVFGLGTRAVNRVEGDYPRMAALDEPLRRPYADIGDVRNFSQHEVDLINTKENSFQTRDFIELIAEKAYPYPERIACVDEDAGTIVSEKSGKPLDYWIITLDDVFENKKLINTFQEILKTLETSYDYPVEIEFTVNFTRDNAFKINLLQCRPLQTRGVGRRTEIPKDVKKDSIFFKSKGYFLGGNISQNIGRIIYVNPEKYTELPMQDKYEVARIVGRLNRMAEREALKCILIGPGRWGTTTPSLGIPVKFAEINNVTALIEVASRDNLMPELSFGTHFFQDLVETDIFYVALFPDKEGSVFNEGWLKRSGGKQLTLPETSPKYKNVVSVYSMSDNRVKIMSDVVSQKVICFSQEKET